MDPSVIIAARQQQERLSEVSRRFHRHGAPRRSPRVFRVAIGFGFLRRALAVVKSWRLPVRVDRSVREGSES
jgi:hypothetical protein